MGDSVNLLSGERAATPLIRPIVGGLLDEVALYDRALTAAEIQQIYAAAGEARCKTVQKWHGG
jgi:hypothetical protein